MTVDVGTQASPSFPDCTGFAADDNLYTGDLSDFQTTYGAAGSGLDYSPNGLSPWTNGDTVVYRVTLTLQSHASRDRGELLRRPHLHLACGQRLSRRPRPVRAAPSRLGGASSRRRADCRASWPGSSAWPSAWRSPGTRCPGCEIPDGPRSYRWR